LVSHLVMPSDQKNNLNSKGDCKSKIYKQQETKRGTGIRILTEAIIITNNKRNL